MTLSLYVKYATLKNWRFTRPSSTFLTFVQVLLTCLLKIVIFLYLCYFKITMAAILIFGILSPN